MFELNPLDVLKKRELRFIPQHFSTINYQGLFDNDVKNWIKNNLKGRYALVKTVKVGELSSKTLSTIIAFEDEKELTYFTLACPYLRR